MLTSGVTGRTDDTNRVNDITLVEDINVLRRCVERERLARKEAERLLEDRSRELYTAQRQLEHQYESLKMTQGQLVHAEKMASVGQLAAGIAHEINNPIGFVTSNMQTLADYIEVYELLLNLYVQWDFAAQAGDTNRQDNLRQQIHEVRKSEDIDYISEDVVALLRESQDGLKRVREIVQNLKSFVHLGDAQEQMANLNDGIEATLKVVWNELKYKCRVEKNLGALPMIRCFASELNQVFMNLLVNAAQAIQENGVITICTYATDAEVVVQISDTGCGISAENLSKLFTPFYTTKSVGRGTGLGLSISWGIVRKHGGVIEVDSQVDEGSVFTVRLPVRSEQDVIDTAKN